MKVYVKDENCNAKNSTTFYSNNIRNVPIEDDEIMHHFKSLSDFMGNGATEAFVRRYSSKWVFLKIRNIHKKTPVLESNFDKIASLTNLSKRNSNTCAF